VQIDLTELVGNDGVVLAGMERGVAAREKFTLDDLDGSLDTVVVTAPSTLEAISPSFVQGFLAGSLKSLGEEKLHSKYKFELSELLMEDITEGIRHLLMKRKIAGLD
jgi:hypothetical protein